MNIFIHVEIAARELDSKLLLAVNAASRGHTVLISDIGGIMGGVRRGALSPGIFYTKSLTPSDKQIARHQILINNGILVTSIDEEGGLIDHGYEGFAAARYSARTIEQASAIFGWGTEDTETLKRLYPRYSSKIHRTGSPRADLWRARFNKYWGIPRQVPQKPYLLISSNMGIANNIRRFHDILQLERDLGYYQRTPEMFSNKFETIAEQYRMTLSFVEAVRHLAESSDKYDIVFRPHPVENIEAWKVYLEGIPNVHVIREGSITAWVKSAFAVMHNGCTTALESTVSGQPVITYLPFEQQCAREIPNELGVSVSSLDALSDTVNEIFYASRSGKGVKTSEVLPKCIAKKIYLDDEGLAAERIVKVWESLDDGELSRQCNWRKLQLQLSLAKLKGAIASKCWKVSPRRFSPATDNWKFPPLDIADVRDRVSRLRQILGIQRTIECIHLGERALLIRPR